jgi:hypothetical protein
MVQGFFETFLLQIAQSINEKFSMGAILEVKHLRKAMEIKSSDRSKIIFLARALQKLNDLGFLEFVGRNSPKKFKVTGKIPIDDLQKKINT